MKSLSTFLLLAGLVIALSCSNENEPARTKIVNPNGDSELALLMREMWDEGMAVKASLVDGKNPDINVAYNRIHTAKATQPEKVATPEYEAYAKAYENAVEQFKSADAAHRAGTYQYMVETCMNCHKEMCTGPMPKIKKMYLSDAELQKLTVSSN